MGLAAQMEEEVQGKKADGRNEEEGVGGIDGASGACTRRGARQASFCLFHGFKYFAQIYYTIWDRYPKIINVFGLYFMISSILSQIYYTIWD